MEKKVDLKRKNGRISVLLWIIVLAALFGTGLTVGFMSAPKHNSPVGPYIEVRYLNGKLGGGVLIAYPDNKLVLLDPGPAECADDLISYLGRKRAEKLTIFISDSNQSTFGAVDSLVDTFSVSQVVIPEDVEDNHRWRTSLARIKERNIKIINVSEGDSIILTENSAMQILAPIGKQDEKNKVNKLVGRLLFGNVSFLFPSILDPDEEAILVESTNLLSSNVLHVSTKSYNSTSLELLSQVRPEYCVVSNVPGRRRPTTSLLQRIDPLNTGAELLQSTAKNSVILRTDGNEVKVHE